MQNQPGATMRYTQLDSLRGIGAIVVFCAHFLMIKINLPVFEALKPTPLGVLLNGIGAVTFFFVLSGFVLALPFVGDKKTLTLTAFYTKRILRIYPALIFAVLLSVGLKQFVFDNAGLNALSGWVVNCWDWQWTTASYTELWQTLVLIGPDFNVNHIDPPIWSLVVEMKMSLVLPFMIVIAARSNLTLNLVVLGIITAFTYRYQNFPVPAFYLGILMARYKHPLLTQIRQWPLPVLIAGIMLSVFLYNNNYEFVAIIRNSTSPYKYTFSYYFVALGSALGTLIVLARQRIANLFARRGLVAFGEISYSFYLVHKPFLLTMASLFSNRFAYSGLYIFVSAFVLTVSCSWLMYRFIEKPFLNFAIGLTRRYRALNAMPI